MNSPVGGVEAGYLVVKFFLPLERTGKIAAVSQVGRGCLASQIICADADPITNL